MSLVDEISSDISPKLASAIQHIFNNLGLPIPEEGEYLFGGGIDVFGKRGLVFLDRFATVIKFDKHIPSHCNEHPLILKPAAAFLVETDIFNYGIQTKYDVEILSGIRVGLEPAEKLVDSDEYFLTYELRKAGIDYYDSGNAGNVGYFIGTKNTRFPRGIPVILDRKSCGYIPNIRTPGHLKLNEPIDPETEVNYPDEYAFAQDHIIGILQHRFKQAWPDFNKDADPRKMQFFWEICAGLAKSGLTTAGWRKDQNKVTTDYKSAKAHRFGEKYADHLEKFFADKSAGRK